VAVTANDKAAQMLTHRRRPEIHITLMPDRHLRCRKFSSNTLITR
jgi:hypothetical protein